MLATIHTGLNRKERFFLCPLVVMLLALRIFSSFLSSLFFKMAFSSFLSFVFGLLV